MRRRSFFIAIVSWALFAQAVSFADVVVLKNGRTLEGEILDGDSTGVIVRTKIGKVRLERGEITSLKKKELPGDFFGSKAAEDARSVPKPLISSGPETPLKAEGYGKAASLSYNLSISAELKQLRNGDAMLVKYNTNLPIGSVLYLSLRSGSRILAVRKQTVEGSSFAIRLGPFDGKRFNPGGYMVEVSFLSSRQESEEIKKRMSGVDDMVATAEIRVGSAGEAEELAARRKAELRSELKELTAIYTEMNKAYASQKRDFNRDVWDLSCSDWKGRIEKIKDFDAAYRKKMLVLDYSAEENNKMLAAETLGRLALRYTEDLYKSHGLDFKLPPSPDNRDTVALNRAMGGVFDNIRGFMEELQ